MHIAEAVSLVAQSDPARPVLVAGPTASGKSALALAIAEAAGGAVVNADASQVYECWHVLTARPSAEEESRAPHRLYGHVSEKADYSVGHWLREVTALNGLRPIITGGTGLYFKALTEGLAQVPATPDAIRSEADQIPLETLVAELDPKTAQGIDLANRARVQRAWEVLRNTGKGLSHWQAQTAAPLMPLPDVTAFVLDVDRDWLNDRIARRFDAMITGGALDEVRTLLPRYDPSLPAHRAIGAPELIAHLRGETTLTEAKEAAIIATRQYAKRQRTWARGRMTGWHRVILPEG